MDVRSKFLVGTLVFALLCVAGMGIALGDAPSGDDGSYGSSSSLTSELASQHPTLYDTQTESYPAPHHSDVTRQDYTETGLDVSSAVASDADALRGELTRDSFRIQFEETPTSDRQEFVDEMAASIQTRMESLDESHGSLIAAYSENELSADRLLGEYLRVIEQVEEHRLLISTVETVTAESDDASLSEDVQTEFDKVGAEILVLPTPVIDDYRDAVRSQSDQQSVYVQASADAIVLSTITPHRHTRQATLRGERIVGGTDQFAEDGDSRIVEAFERAEELYPSIRVSIGAPFAHTTVYRVDSPQSQGELVSFIDGATRNVFHEIRSIDPALVNVTGTHQNSTDSLQLDVETTDPSGPMHVSVTDSTGSPVDATVTVGDWTVGSTDPNGELWTIQPLGELSVTATDGDDESVTVTLP